MSRRVLTAVTAVSLCLGATAFAAKTPVIHDIAPGSRPDITADEKGHLHVAYEGFKTGSKVQEIFYVESSDDGATWTSPVNISKTPGTSSHPDMEIEHSGAIDVVWSDSTPGVKYPDIFFSRSTDGGKSWIQPVDIATTPGKSSDPCLDIGPDNSIHVAWCDTSTGDNNQDIYYSYSVDCGKTWGKNSTFPDQDISSTPGASTEPTIAVDDEGIVHVAWVDTSSKNQSPQIYYAQKTKDSWTKAANVSKTSGVAFHPNIDCGKGKVFLAWSDNSNKSKNPQILCMVGNRRGEFNEQITISTTPGSAREAAISADISGRVGIVWTGVASGTTKPDVYGRISVDNLDDVSKVLNLSNQQGMSKHPDVTICGSKMFAAWEQSVGGKSLLKITTRDMNDVATGPSREAGSLHAVPSNSR